ncbi:MAG TPA: hypothetical protein VII11_06205 [Bacteroidota bacterium]
MNKRQNSQFENDFFPKKIISKATAGTLFIMICMLCSCDSKSADQQLSDREALLNAHESVLEAHRNNDVDIWNSLEAETLVVANRGDIHRAARADREEGRRAYFAEATFSVYRDVQPPLVTVSADGSLGWLIAQVEIVGEYKKADGSSTPINDVWAWIELYEKRSGRWVGVGNVSNVRPARSN